MTSILMSKSFASDGSLPSATTRSMTTSRERRCITDRQFLRTLTHLGAILEQVGDSESRGDVDELSRPESHDQAANHVSGRRIDIGGLPGHLSVSQRR
jgi:hypothetical protein